MLKKKSIIPIALLLIAGIGAMACGTTKKGVKFTKSTIPKKARLAIIVDSPNNIKNVILTTFMSKGFRVSAVNASDLYSMEDSYDITDFTAISHNSAGGDSLESMEKTYNSIYKLHTYNFEINKAQMLNEMGAKWQADYLIILDYKNWQDVSWGRAINLSSKEIVWIENYPTGYTDDIVKITEHFIDSMTSR